MTGLNGWNVVGGFNDDCLNAWLTSWWNDAVNSGHISPTITIAGWSATLSDPTVAVGPAPEPGTGWENTVVAGIDMTISTSTGKVTVEVNVEELFLGVVRQGTYLSCDGVSGSYADCGELPGALPDTGYTLMVWVNLQTLAAQTLASVVDGSGETQLALSLNDSVPSLYLSGKKYAYTPGGTAPAFKTGTWHQVAVVVDPNAGSAQCRFYLDGQPQGSVAINSVPALSGRVQVGNGFEGAGSLNGLGTGVSVWSSPLSDGEVMRLMNADPSSGSLPDGLTCLGGTGCSIRTIP